MFAYNQPSYLHQAAAPVVSSGSNLGRYERSPPSTQRTLSVTLRTSTNGEPFREDVTLHLRQQPKEALVTAEGKEKTRKPVDPPPIIQLTVKPQADPAQHFLQSPYLFMCTSLYKEHRDEAWDGTANKSLAGSLVSSLHRLKDVDNKDGGFFVFGDISVKIQGTFRLHFSLFDLRKDTNEVLYLGSITSEPFKVLLPKDFKGMDESTYLSRAFSDQGVRLRLRKEPRAMMGNKRPYPYGVDTPQASSQMRPNMSEYSYDDSSPNKRFRSENEDFKREPYPDHSSTTYSTSYTPAQFTGRQPSLTGLHNSMASYPNFTGGITTGTTSPYQFRGIGNSSSYMADNLLSSSSGAVPSSLGTMAGPHRYTDLQNPSYNMFPYGGQAGSGIGLGDPRPATATGVAPSMSLPHSTPQSQHSSHQSHDSLSSSRGGSYSQSPEMLRNTGLVERFPHLGSNLPDSSRSANRYDDPSQLTHSLYSHQSQRKTLPALTAESSLTSHTDSGTLQPSHIYNLDLTSTEQRGLDSR
ncbi:velvet factor-domain-containing protein [Lophiotrema nucula]|uniref:Velvet factor-domain-containing protein n=1 Tax=Lophiotrema nucula TaxID=690887 RepID=A0A6A5ZD03_9PLEO|nr:velvet factor-domain-containing protein [Lophiotrema nucula]